MTWQSAGRAIWRYKWIAAGLTALLVLATAYLVGRQTPIYETNGAVRIVQKVPPGELPALDTAAQNAASYSVLVSGTEFAKLVVAQVATTLPDATEREVLGTVWAEPIPGTDILTITASGPSPERITALANAATPALKRLAATQGAREIVLPVNAAGVPDSPVSPKTRLAIAVALVIGLVVNGALMVLLDLLRDRFANTDELEAATGKPVLATVPRFSRSAFVIGRVGAAKGGVAADREREASS